MKMPTALSILAGAALAATMPFAAQARDSARTVQFAKGTTATTLAGVVKGYDVHRYYVTARAGQQLTVTLNTNKLDVILGGAEDGETLEGPFTLTRSGRHEIKVLQMRAAARRGAAVPYKITIGIR